MDFLSELQWRGMIHDVTEEAADAFSEGPVTAYIGFDPTAPSLHVGNLLTVMGLVHLQRAGHHPIAVAGGGTGLIGDPSGRSDERQLLTKELAAENLEGIKVQLGHYLDFEAQANPARMVNNLDWLGELQVVDFYRDIGKHFSVNSILKKESVRRRLEDEEHGISYTEFSYLLLQAYDFLELHDRYGCTAQMGGSDQWGNITAGIDLIRRMRGAKAHGVVFPLLTTSSGTKFGKTEAGAVWLDPELTSPYRFHQYWLNVEDGDVVRFLKRFTLLDQDEISALAEDVEARPHERAAQKALADHVTRRLHGDSELERAKQAGSVLFGGEILGLGADEIEDIFSDVPSSELSRETLGGEGKELVELLSESGVASSRGDARRSMEGGGIYLNNVRVEEVDRSVSLDDTLEGKFLVLRKGKKSYHLVRVTD
jgi:tyrosyl-tRNA synthetase